MATKLHKSAQRVQDFFAQLGQEIMIKEFAQTTRSAQEAANSINCEVGQIAKSIIFMITSTKEPILVITSGSNRVDTAKIEDALNIKLEKADAKFIKQYTGYSIGGVPPVGHLNPVKTIIDTDLQQWNEVWAAAGTPFTVFRISPQKLGELTAGQWMDVAVVHS